MDRFDLDALWPLLTQQAPGSTRSPEAKSSRRIRDDDIAGALSKLPERAAPPVPWVEDGSEEAIEDEPVLQAASSEARPWRLHWQQASEQIQRSVRAVDRRAASFGFGGFAAGLAVAYSIGFWGFVSDAVLKQHGVSASHQTERRIETGSISPQDVRPRPSGIRFKDCAELVFDKDQQKTVTVPCAAPPSRQQETSARDGHDPAQAALEHAPADPEIRNDQPLNDQAGTLSQSDINLNSGSNP